jgi:hypothetical protein
MVQVPISARVVRGWRGALTAAVLAMGVALSLLLPARTEGANLPEAGKPTLPDLHVSYTSVIAYDGKTKVVHFYGPSCSAARLAAHAVKRVAAGMATA